MTSDSEIIKLWRDPSFDGSYRGVRTFQIFLKLEHNIDVSLKHLYKILNTDQIYLIHKTSHKTFPRRHYYVHNYGELVQMDIAHMFEDPETGFQYFLLLVDVFSSRVFTKPLKTREDNDIIKALVEIIKSFKSQIYVLQADREKSFLSVKLQTFLKSKDIIFRPKFGKNKASQSELYIQIVKRKLYMLLRGTLSQKWVAALNNVVKSLNNTPIKRLGWLRPIDIQSEVGSAFVDQAKRDNNVPILKEATYVEHRHNITSYSGDLKVLDYVYKDFDKKIFDKSFDVSVSWLQCKACFLESKKAAASLMLFV